MNNKKYWLRGGVVGVVLVIIYFLYGTYQSCGVGFGSSVVCSPKVYWNDLIFSITEAVWYVLTGLIVLFVVGAFLGWIYGKIKNRNQIPQV